MSQVQSADLIPFLRRQSIFSLLDEVSIEQLAQKMELHRYSIGDVIVAEGEIGQHAFLIYSGRVRVVKKSQTGRSVTLGTQHAGEIFGEQAILKDATRSASVRAAEDVALFRIHQSDFRQLLESTPQLADYVEQFMNDAALRDFLRTSTILELLKPKDITALLDQLKSVEFPQGQVVVSEGSPGDCMYIVRTGQLKVERSRTDNEQQFVRFIGDGEYFGEWALMTGEVRSATVTTVTQTSCFSLGKEQFDAFLESAPKLRDQLANRFRNYGITDRAGITDRELDSGPTKLDLRQPDSQASRRELKAQGGDWQGSTATSVDSQANSNARISDEIYEKWTKDADRELPVERGRIRMQLDESDCGPAALAMVADAYGVSLPISDLRDLAAVGPAGTSLFDLAKTAERVGFETSVVRTKDLDEILLPAVVHLKSGHFVTIFSVNYNVVRVGDPAAGMMRIRRSDFDRASSGHVILLRPNLELQESPQIPAFLDQLKTAFLFNRKLLWQTFGFSLLLGLLLCLAVFSIALAIDLSLLDTSLAFNDVWFPHGSLAYRFYNALWQDWNYLITLPVAAFAWGALIWSRRRSLEQFWQRSRIISERWVNRHLLSSGDSSFQKSRKLERLLDAQEELKNIICGGALLKRMDPLQFLCVGAIAWVIFKRHGSDTRMIIGSIWVAGVISLCVLCWVIVRVSHLRQWNIAHLDAPARDASPRDSALLLNEPPKNIAASRTYAVSPRAISWAYGVGQRETLYQRAVFTTSVVALLFVLAVVFCGFGAVYRGTMTLGELFVLACFAGLSYSICIPDYAMHVIGPRYRVLLETLWAASVKGSGLKDRPSRLENSEPTESPAAKQPMSVAKQLHIRLADVSASYSSELPNAIENISLDIPFAQKVGVVGRSGAGKTSILKSLAGHIRPATGYVRLGADDLHTFSASDLKHTIASVWHADSLLVGSVAQNIADFDTDFTREQLNEAASRACALREIEQLPNGWNTILCPGGVAVSRCLTQRILLARTFMCEPSIVIWDEATSQIDNALEDEIFQANAGWLAQRTFVLATRRLKQVHDADQIIVIDQGTVIERGTHIQLNSANGLYQYLHANS